MNAQMYDSPFCNVQYIEKDHVVLLAWKKACSFGDYRSPSLFMLWLLQEHPVVWGFTHLIPMMAQTGCQSVIFIMNPDNEIEGEMDMWGNEFCKYFQLFRTDSYEQALLCGLSK